MTVQDTLEKRDKQYGKFADVASISAGLQRTMRTGRNWEALPDDMRESLQTIASKIARILNGDCEHIDSWHDIAGYATLVEERLKGAEARLAQVPDAVPPAGFTVWYQSPDGSAGSWHARNSAGNVYDAESRDAALARAIAGG